MQSRRMSLIETCFNTLTGFGLSWLVQVLLVPAAVPTCRMSTSESTLVTIGFTVLSLVRTYVVRRWFNWLHHK